MSARTWSALMAFGWLVLAPGMAFAQASITGVVRDSSGAVLPGVTVEAASPALIEKVRSVVTDGAGQYRIVDLRPGQYSLTLSLPGFNIVKRDGIELTGTFTATINAELRVGALEETVTVTGETPTVDVQSATRERVITREIVDTIPAGRTPYHLGVLIPGVSIAGGTNNIVGATSSSTNTTMTIHGSRNTEQLIMQNGMANSDVSGSWNIMYTNPATVQEMVFDTGAAPVDSNGGGVRINVIPKDGGNVYNGTVFASVFGTGKLQANNLDDDLRRRGAGTPNSIKENWDINPGFGGPIRKDRLWFYGSGRVNVFDNYATGAFYNRNANNPNAWTYDPDRSQPASNDTIVKDGQLRLTWQATTKNKLAMIWHEQISCSCLQAVTAQRSPEAAEQRSYPINRGVQLDWTSPVTNRLLLEVGFFYYNAVLATLPWPDLNVAQAPISVTEQSTGLVYRARLNYSYDLVPGNNSRAALTYITGAHRFKVGFNNQVMRRNNKLTSVNALSYRLNNGVPNQLTQVAYGAGNAPLTNETRMSPVGGVYAQDQWTIRRLTATYGLRYDFYRSRYLESVILPALYAPTRNFTIPAQDNVHYDDLSPRLGAAYDLFGTGKTAVKASVNRYVATLNAAHTLIFTPHPASLLVTQTARTWTDANRDFVADCDLLSKAANGECGAMANQNFGSVIQGATYDPDLMRGFGKREYNWEFGASVQHELLPQTSVEVGYFRRWYGNFLVTDNLAVGPGDYSSFSITAPVDSRLPGGGGSVISGLYDLNPNKFGVPAQNLVTRASNYGKQLEHWNGFDFTLNTRVGKNLLMQGGASTGRTMTDNCEVRAAIGPELQFGSTTLGTANAATVQQPESACHLVSSWLTQVKALASYTIPRVDVLVSGTLQSTPSPQLLANYNAPNALVAPSLGRPLSGAAANTTVNLVTPGTLYGDRLTQVDLRVGKRLSFGKTRALANVDFYNALNANPVLVENVNFGAWRQPSAILLGRVVKFSVQADF